MKYLLFIIFAALLLIGCESKSNPSNPNYDSTGELWKYTMDYDISPKVVGLEGWYSEKRHESNLKIDILADGQVFHHEGVIGVELSDDSVWAWYQSKYALYRQ